MILIEAVADVNAKNNDGYTALMMASGYGHTKVVKTLISYEAKINDRDKWGRTALMNASEKGHKDIVEMLIDKGANLKIKRAKLLWI